MNISKALSRTRLFTEIDDLERNLAARQDVVQPSDISPSRFDILRGRLEADTGGPPVRLLPTMLRIVSGIKESLQTVEDNPPDPSVQVDEKFIDEIRATALKLGVSSVGFTRVPPRWVFQGKAIAYPNAIMLAMEMDKPSIDSAPSLACMRTVMDTYRDLGIIGNQLAAKIRERGYAAHAGHPLNGLALYPPLAQAAGLGQIGLNGLIITPEHGPRVRLAAVFTNIENLPFNQGNPHSWVADFCESCKACIKKCPPDALYGTPKDHGDGRLTFVSTDLCFPYFNEYHGCSVCVAVCPFNNLPYQQIQEGTKSLKRTSSLNL